MIPPRRLEDNGRRTHPAGSQRGMAGRVPRNRKQRPDYQSPTWTARRKIKKDLTTCQIFPISIF